MGDRKGNEIAPHGFHYPNAGIFTLNGDATGHAGTKRSGSRTLVRLALAKLLRIALVHSVVLRPYTRSKVG
jgi:hypothetical protein